MGLLDRVLGRSRRTSCFELGYCQGIQAGKVPYLDFRAKRVCHHYPRSGQFNVWVNVMPEHVTPAVHHVTRVVPIENFGDIIYVHVDLTGVHWDFGRPVRMAYGIACNDPCVPLGGEMDVDFTTSNYYFRDFEELLHAQGYDDDLEQMKAMGVERRRMPGW
jgi:hypothetical protein